MRADDGVRFKHKESGKKIYHFVSSHCIPCRACGHLISHACNIYHRALKLQASQTDRKDISL